MRLSFLVFGLALFSSPANSQPVEEKFNDYPTVARADYIFGCMASNGKGREVMRKCSCSIDVLASIVTYDDYVKAETVLSMQLTGGERMSIFRTAHSAKLLVANLRRAQAEADLICF